MSFSLPERVTLKGPNFIREVFERGVGVEGFISFGIGNPAPEAIPVEIIEKAFDEVVHSNPMSLLQYGPMQGDARLAELTLDRLVKAHKMNPEGQGLIISNGAGQLLGLVPITVLEPGDEVYMDEFTFTSAINSVRNMGGKALGIKTDEYGMIPSELEKAAQSGKGKYIYLIPNFQNPTGITMPLERRKEIYAIASKYDLFIYEDDPYGDLLYMDTPALPKIKSFDASGHVIYAGSFSKILAPGSRLGFLLAPKPVFQKLVLVKQVADSFANLYWQYLASQLIEDDEFNAHIAYLKQLYQVKMAAMVTALQQYGSEYLSFVAPDGGYFVSVKLNDDIDPTVFYDELDRRHVGVIPGNIMSAAGQGYDQYFRLNFTLPTPETITEGVKRIAAAAAAAKIPQQVEV